MVGSIINSKYEEASIILLGANYDRTSSFGKGADKAIKAIKSCLDGQIELYNRYTKTIPSSSSRIAFKDMGELNKLSPGKMVEKVSSEFNAILEKGKFPILIGGEHSVSNGAALAISRKFKPSDITIVQFDAHFDLRNDDSDYNDNPHGKYAHSTIMRRSHELGFNLVQVGIRAYSKDELDYALKNKGTIKFFEWGSGDALFKPYDIDDILSSIKTKSVYISIDVDGFDPSVMPETGTPVPGGMSWDYGVKLINRLFNKKIVLGADIVEVAPEGRNSCTAYNAAQLAHNIIAQAALRRH